MNVPLPALDWLRRYEPKWLRGDVVAGITLAAYLLPAALGDASLANLPPEAGLYACLFGGLVFWLFCSSRHTAITVTSAISLLVGASLGGDCGRRHDPVQRAGGGHGAARGAHRLHRLAGQGGRDHQLHLRERDGRVQVWRGAVPRQHAVAQVVWHPRRPMAISGRTAAISFKHLHETNPASLTIGGAALAVLVLGKVFLKNKPVALFVVVGGIVASGLLGLDARGVKLLGEVPQGLPPSGCPGR